MTKFGDAFAAARKAGKKEFTHNGKKYNTKTKEEAAAKGPSKVPDRRPDTKKAPKEPVKGLKKVTAPKPKPSQLPDGRKPTKGKKYTGPAGTPNAARAARKGYKTGGGF
jgi:hypothetical protein